MKTLRKLFFLLIILSLLVSCADPAPVTEAEPATAAQEVDEPEAPEEPAEAAQPVEGEDAATEDSVAEEETAPQTPPELADGAHWMEHFTNEILPFWAVPDALGDPLGNWPSERCDDGTAYSADNPCPEIHNNGWLNGDLEYVVSRSRQTYGYGVAFHLTGDPIYLEYMAAGVDYLRANAFDRIHGGTFATSNNAGENWGPEPDFRNPQELAYSLLGISFYYYLTRDAEVLPDILAVEEYIFENYYNADLNALQWMLASDGNRDPMDKQLTAQLDNLNAYMVLMYPVLPKEHQANWAEDMRLIADIMMTEFYNADENLFFLSANSPDEVTKANAATDFGHTIKAIWMIYNVGLLLEDQELIDFAMQAGPGVLEQAYIVEEGTWANGVDVGGKRMDDKDWWVYNELDQFAMTFALQDEDIAAYLPYTAEYFFQYFVDHEYGEIWTMVDGKTNQPKAGSLPKAWPWKSAYHSFEHAMIGYITGAQLAGEQVTLYYAFDGAVDAVNPYFFQGDIVSQEVIPAAEFDVVKVVFENIK